MKSIRLSRPSPACSSASWARARAASMNWGSLSVTSACKGRVGPLAANRADLAAGGIEDIHRGRRRGSLPEGVDAAAIEILALVTLVDSGVALGHGHGFPDALRLIGSGAAARPPCTPAGCWRPARNRGSSPHPCGSEARVRAADCAGLSRSSRACLPRTGDRSPR